MKWNEVMVGRREDIGHYERPVVCSTDCGCRGGQGRTGEEVARGGWVWAVVTLAGIVAVVVGARVVWGMG